MRRRGRRPEPDAEADAGTGARAPNARRSKPGGCFRTGLPLRAGAARSSRCRDRLPEIAFAGRSNVGKSSLINALTGRSTLARTSHTPGRTQQINFFDLGGRLMLVDLPGYGYAAAPKSEIARWTELIAALSARAAPRCAAPAS